MLRCGEAEVENGSCSNWVALDHEDGRLEIHVESTTFISRSCTRMYMLYTMPHKLLGRTFASQADCLFHPVHHFRWPQTQGFTLCEITAETFVGSLLIEGCDGGCSHDLTGHCGGDVPGCIAIYAVILPFLSHG